MTYDDLPIPQHAVALYLMLEPERPPIAHHKQTGYGMDTRTPLASLTITSLLVVLYRGALGVPVQLVPDAATRGREAGHPGIHFI